MEKPNRILCKRTLTIGDYNRDNRMLVAGDWYDVVYNVNDNDDTFSIIDNQGHMHLHYMYGDENDDNYRLSRTYAKWFYTPNELRKKKLRKRKRKIIKILNR